MLLPDFREQSYGIDDIVGALKAIRMPDESLANKIRKMEGTPLERSDRSKVIAGISFLLTNELSGGKLLGFKISIVNPNVIVATIDMTDAEIDDFPIK